MEKLNILIQKFESEKITYEIKDYPGNEKRILFHVPSGRIFSKCILIPSGKYIDIAVGSTFEKFKFLNGYEAIWSSELKILEVEIYSANDASISLIHKLKRLMGDGHLENNKMIELPQIGDIKISIGSNTTEFSILSGSRSSFLMLSFPTNRITLKISNVDLKEHDQTKDFLEKISNAIFFQIDLLYNVAFILKAEKESFGDQLKRRRLNRAKAAKMPEIKYDYDKEPISLYWHAKELSNMPLFQFLAFYQVVEFYFPVYSSNEAKQKIQNLIKDPRFDPSKDSDITKIITTIKISSDGNSFGSEREQLRATLNACVDYSDLKEFFMLEPIRQEFFNESKKCLKISKQKLSLNSNKADLLNEVSERVYDIRCKIVHSKVSGNSSDVLLPYSAEVKDLKFDIAIIEFISRKVLISNSTPLNLNIKSIL